MFWNDTNNFENDTKDVEKAKAFVNSEHHLGDASTQVEDGEAFSDEAKGSCQDARKSVLWTSTISLQCDNEV